MALATLCFGDILVQGATIIDGTGRHGYVADVRIKGSKIADIGALRPGPSDKTVAGHGFVLAPGFIDAHSHADSNLDSLRSQVAQGITTAVVGQDGFNRTPVFEFFKSLETSPRLMNFACFSGHGSARSRVMGDDYRRRATSQELLKMKRLVEKDMKSGALGLSTGLEYDPGHYSTTEELIVLSRVIAKFGGIYISHMRDEGNGLEKSVQELVRIGRQARVHAQISHIKAATAPVWGKAPRILDLLERANRNGVVVTADIYPYSFWQSTVTALTTSRDFTDPAVWEKALRETGGADRVTLTKYSPNKSWEGKTLAVLAQEISKTPAEVIIEIVQSTRDGRGDESVLCEAMTEPDIEAFLRWPQTMLCSDGQGGGTHPRSAGAFPRVLARYVRERKTVSLEDAVRKMTSLPAKTFGLLDRGTIKTGMVADLVLFDPEQIQDNSTAAAPTKPPSGISHVIVNGQIVMVSGVVQSARPGVAVRRSRSGSN